VAGTSGPSNPVLYVVDTQAPDKPVITSPADASTIDTGLPLITGTAKPSEVGGSISVTDSAGALLCKATVESDGTWSCTPTKALADGPHTIKAIETDMAGNVSPASDPVTFTVITAAPGAPRITEPTSSNTPTSHNRPTIRGDKGTPGETVTVTNTTDTGTHTVCTAEVQSDGTWECDPVDPLPDGTNTLTATQTDPDTGTSAPSNAVVVVVDTHKPAAPVITSPKDGSTITSHTPQITGTADPSEVGGTIEVTDSSDATLCTATIQTGGSWSCTPPSQLANGKYTIEATETSVTGIVGAVSAPVSFTIVAAPSKPSTPVVDPTNGKTVTGKTDIGTTITVTDNKDNPVPGCVDIPADEAGHFSCTPVTPLVPGTVIKVTATDGSGNQSDPATVTVQGSTNPAKPNKPTVNTGGQVAATSLVPAAVCVLAGLVCLAVWRKRRVIEPIE